MSEAQESIVRQQAILMINRNYNKKRVVKRIMMRFLKCMRLK